MLIEKVITNFSDVSLWAIALVVGYVLIGAILLLRLAWKRKHTKMENVTQNTPIEQSKEIYRERVKMTQNLKIQTPQNIYLSHKNTLA